MGKFTFEAKTSASSVEVTAVLSTTGSFIEFIAVLKESRFSAFLIDSNDAPNTSTLFSFNIPLLLKDNARFNPICPPRCWEYTVWLLRFNYLFQ